MATSQFQAPLFFNAPSANLASYIQASQNTSLYVSGDNTFGELGTGNTNNVSFAVAISNFLGTNQSFKQIVSGYNHFAALDTLGNLYTWGINTNGQLGTGDTLNRSNATQIPGNSWSAIGTGQNTTYGITTNGLLWAWGSNVNGAVGNGTTIDVSSPVQISGTGDTSFNLISNIPYGNFAFARGATTGAIYYWGYNNQAYGISGINKTASPIITAPMYANQPFPSPNTSITGITATPLSTAYFSYANGAIYSAGANFFGELGQNISTTSGPLGQVVGIPPVSKVQAGGANAIAMSDTYVYTWGYNALGQLGNGTTLNSSSPVAVALPNYWALINFKQVAMSSTADHGLGIDTLGNMYAWGTNAQGQLGDGTVTLRSSPAQIGLGRSWSMVSSGWSSSSAIDTTGALWTWGYNQYGQLGDGTTVNKSSPVQIGTSSWTLVQSGYGYTAAIDINGRLFAWGFNPQQNLGLGDTAATNRSSPVQVSIQTQVNSWKAIGTGTATESGFGIAPDGSLWAWGLNTSGQLGDGTATNRSIPVKIGNSSWSAVSGGFNFTVAIDAVGRLFGWGSSIAYANGTGATVNLSSPVQVGTLSSWIAVSAGDGHMVALLGSSASATSGILLASGANSLGQLGLGTTVTAFSSPSQVGAASNWTEISAGQSNTAAIDTTGALWTWGSNGNGYLGIGTTVGVSSPTRVTFGSVTYSSWTALGSVTSNLNSHAMAIGINGTLWGWGGNSFGQLGDGTTVNKSTPVQIGIGTSWVQVGVGASHGVGLDSAGNLWAWGANNVGQLGNGTTINSSSPVQILPSSGISWAKLACGDNHILALTTTGALYSWGTGPNGQLGTGTYLNYSSPVKVGTSSWSVISAGQVTSGAIDINGRLFTWGINNVGGLGNGSTSLAVSSPVLIGSSSWTAVTMGASTSFYIRKDGLLFAAGYNGLGVFGNGTTINTSSPVQIGTSSWTSVALNSYISAGILTNGLLYTWGQNNTAGVLGSGTTINRSSPVQIATGLSFAKVTIGSSSLYAQQTTGTLLEWGYNSVGQLGNGTTVSAGTTAGTSAVYLIGTSSWTAVAIGYTSLGITTNGSLYAWGTGNLGLGNGTTISASSPVLVDSSKSWKSVSVGFHNECAAATTTAVYTWGANVYGQLGTGTTTNYSSPVLITSGTPSSFTLGWYTNYLLYATGQLAEWGLNTSGQLGNLTLTNVSSPVFFGTGAGYTNYNYSSWKTVSVGNGSIESTSAIDYTGALWTWGYNGQGQLGDGTTTNRSIPVKIGNSSWSKVSVGYTHMAAIDSTGYLWTWGGNSFGQLGNGLTINSSSPVKIGTSSWSQVSVGWYENGALDINGRLFAWGYNLYGNLGQGNTLNYSSPVQIGTSSWSSISSGEDQLSGLIGQKAYAWGYGPGWGLGTGTATSQSSPVAIYAGSNYPLVQDIATGIYTTIAMTNATRSANANPFNSYGWGINQSGQFGNGTTTTFTQTPVLMSASQYGKSLISSSNTIIRQ